ncbi:MAG: hypothetical protein RSA66_08870 [Muribaculaceae bacterium]
MKHKGATMEYSKERIDDLMRVYDEYISSCRYIRMSDVYNKIVNMPSVRFWVSDIRAALVVSAIIRGEAELNAMWPMKKKMFAEIHKRVILLLEEKPELSISQSCAIVVAQPAPQFYLTAGSAKIMICKARKKWIQEKMKRLRLL